MKENMLDVLMYLFEHYMDDDHDISPDYVDLKIRLEEVGFKNNEIEQAFTWMDGLAKRHFTEANDTVQSPHSMRIFSPFESNKLDMESRGFLVFLEQISVITPITRELIIDRAMALSMDEIDLDKFKWVILMVLFNQPGHESELAWIEDLVFEEMGSCLH